MEDEDEEWTEEDLRSKVICPWLRAVGFQPSELALEFGFRVRIGRDREKLPRADVLVSRDGRTLLVVECKRPGHQFTPRDREQAISYARLVQPRMAPLAVLTNGRETEIFDVLTSVPVEAATSAEIDAWRSIGIEDAIRLRTEAISSFLCLSPANLHRFLNRELDRLVNRSGLRPSYDPAVHVRRDAVADELRRQCAEGAGEISVIVGPSTVGKSSEVLASAAEWLKAGQLEILPLYVPLALAEPDFLPYLAEMFGWQFRGVESGRDLVTTIDRIAVAHGIKCVAYLLDGGEFVDLDALRRRIELLLGHVDPLKSKHRVILTLQASSWAYLRDGRGIALDRRLKEPPIILGPLDPKQQRQLRVNLEKRHGQSLRALQLPPDFWARPALLTMAVELLVDQGPAACTVPGICAAFLAHRLRMSKAREELTDALVQQVEGTGVPDRKQLEDAVAVGILQPIGDDPLHRKYRFADEWVQHYLRCFCVWRLDLARPDQIDRIVAETTDRDSRSALEWYLYNVGGDERWRLVAESTHHQYLAIMRKLTRQLGAVGVDENVTLGFASGRTDAMPWFSLLPGREPRWLDSVERLGHARMVREFAPFAGRRCSEVAVDHVHEFLRGLAQWLSTGYPRMANARPTWPVQQAVFDRLLQKLGGTEYELAEIADLMLGRPGGGAKALEGMFAEGLALAQRIASDEFGAFASRLPRGLRVEVDVAGYGDRARLYPIAPLVPYAEQPTIAVVPCVRSEDSWGCDPGHTFGSLAHWLIGGDEGSLSQFNWRAPAVRARRVPVVTNVARAFLEDLLFGIEAGEIAELLAADSVRPVRDRSAGSAIVATRSRVGRAAASGAVPGSTGARDPADLGEMVTVESEEASSLEACHADLEAKRVE